MKDKSLMRRRDSGKRSGQGTTPRGWGDFGKRLGRAAGRISVCHPVPPFTITWRYTSSTQSRDALHVQPRLRGETSSPQLQILPLSPSLVLFRPCTSPLCDYLSPSATPRFPSFLLSLSLSRQMATITYMCQYITHTASRASPTNPSSTKCTTTSSRPFTLDVLVRYRTFPLSRLPLSSSILFFLAFLNPRAALSFSLSSIRFPLSSPLLFSASLSFCSPMARR